MSGPAARDARQNIVLIGMPGVGKSTAGVLLAKRLAKSFLDTDLVIQQFTCETLGETIARVGTHAFRTLEERCILCCENSNCVVATGGSVVYSEVAMQHLADQALVVHLSLEYELLRGRLGDLAVRGVLMEPGQDLLGLYRERMPLYARYAQHTIHCGGLDTATVAATVEEWYRALQPPAR